MPSRRQALLAAFLAAAFLLMLGLALVASGDWRTAMLNAAAGAGEAAAGPGLVDSMSDHLIPNVSPRVSSLPPPEPASLTAAAAAAAPVPCAAPPCPGTPAADDPAAAAAQAVEEARRKLELVKMKEREQGERRMYGQGSEETQDAGGSDAFAGPARAPDEAAIEASFGGFIQKLKADAARNAPAGGPALGGGRGGDGSGSENGDSPVLHNGRVDGALDSPTLRALEKVNAQTAHSYRMTNNPGLMDGSRDKAGKGFDGNSQTYGEIPIIETKGAMGQKQISVDLSQPASP